MIGLDNILSKLDAVEREVSNLCGEMNKLWTFVHETTTANSSKIDENRSKMEALEFVLGSASDQLTQIQKEKQSMQEDLLYMQSQNMRNNLIFAKVPETDNEDPAKTEAIVRDFMVEKLQIAKSVVDDIKFERVHRMGAKTNAYSRNIVAKFTLYKDRETVKRHRFNLRGTHFSIFEQFPREINCCLRAATNESQKTRNKNQETKRFSTFTVSRLRHSETKKNIA